MKQPTSRILYNYWNNVRRNRMAPSRFEIEPSQIGQILSETFILERGAERAYPFRLAGTRICEQFGRELRGLDLTWLAGGDGEEVLEALETVTRDGAVALFEVEAESPYHELVSFEVLVLPLLHPADEVTRYLGAVSAIDGPAWLGSEPLEPTALLRQEIIWPEGRPHAVLAHSDRQSPFEPAFASARIVRSDRRQFRILDGGRKG